MILGIDTKDFLQCVGAIFLLSSWIYEKIKKAKWEEEIRDYHNRMIEIYFTHSDILFASTIRALLNLDVFKGTKDHCYVEIIRSSLFEKMETYIKETNTSVIRAIEPMAGKGGVESAQLQEILEELKQFSQDYTWCGICGKYTKFSEAKQVTNENKIKTIVGKCSECGNKTSKTLPAQTNQKYYDPLDTSISKASSHFSRVLSEIKDERERFDRRFKFYYIAGSILIGISFLYPWGIKLLTWVTPLLFSLEEFSRWAFERIFAFP